MVGTGWTLVLKVVNQCSRPPTTTDFDRFHQQRMSVLDLYGEAATEPAALWEWLRALVEDGLSSSPPSPASDPTLTHADPLSLLLGYAVTHGSVRRVLEVSTPPQYLPHRRRLCTRAVI
jgi:hypothetical protein